METKTISGEVMDRTESSIQIKKIWIKFFDTELIKDIKTNDNVEVTYQDNKKGERTYHNGKSIILKEVAKLTNVNSISDSTINTLIMTVKEIYLADKYGLKQPLVVIAEEVIRAYKVISGN